MTARRAITRIAWYPVLLAVAFVIKPFTSWNISPVDSARVLAFAVGLSLVLAIACSLALGRDRGGAVAAILVMALAVATTPLTALAFAAAIALLLVEWLLARRGRLQMRVPWARLTEALTVGLVVLIGVQSAMAVNLRLHTPAFAEPAAWRATPAGPKPDIYVVLADGHGRSDVLEDAYGLDLTSFREDLGELGFVESPASHANQMRTLWSLSVLLNGRPLSELGQDMSKPNDPAVPPAALRGNAVFRLLHTAGYDVTAIDPGYAELHLTSADEVVDVGPLNEFEGAIVGETPVGRVLAGGQDRSFEAIGVRVLREVDELTRIATEPHSRPRFVFAHLASPHIPYVFDANCRIDPTIQDRTAVDPSGTNVAPERLAAERDQTICVDGLLSKVAHTIVSNDPDAIVVLFSDHGPDDFFDWSAPEEPGLGYRFANFFSARTPTLASPFPQDVTLVNIFPILFNALWGLDLPLHANDMYLGPTDSRPGFTPYRPMAAPSD